jgi:RPA family protein
MADRAKTADGERVRCGIRAEVTGYAGKVTERQSANGRPVWSMGVRMPKGQGATWVEATTQDQLTATMLEMVQPQSLVLVSGPLQTFTRPDGSHKQQVWVERVEVLAPPREEP